MIELALGPIRRVRFWLGDLPAGAEVGGDERLQGAPVPAIGTATGQRSAAVELYMPVGPRSHYGLLGGYLIPATTGTAHVEAVWDPVVRAGPDWALGAMAVMRGLSNMDAQQVVQTYIAPGIPAVQGTVLVTHALTSPIDTSAVALHTVMGMLLRVLFEPALAESDQRLRALANEAIERDILRA
jgi:hypothetical protein